MTILKTAQALKSIRKQILGGLLSLTMLSSNSPASHSHSSLDEKDSLIDNTYNKAQDKVIPADGTIARQQLVKLIRERVFTPTRPNSKPMLSMQNVNSVYAVQNAPEEFLARVETYLERKDSAAAEHVFFGFSGELIDDMKKETGPRGKVYFDKLTNVVLPDILEEAKRLKKIYGDKKVPQTKRYHD